MAKHFLECGGIAGWSCWNRAKPNPLAMVPSGSVLLAALLWIESDSFCTPAHIAEARLRVSWTNQSQRVRPMMTTSSDPPIALPDIDWVEIPGGAYIYQDGKSRTLPTFYLARYPITNLRYQAFIDVGGYDDARWWQGIERTKPQESRWPQAERPCTSVNWYEAVAFSRWLGEQLGYTVRLPTEE